MPTQPKHYHKRMEECDALQFTGSNAEDMLSFCPTIYFDVNANKLFLGTSEIKPNFWVYKDMAGEFMVSGPSFLVYWQGPPQEVDTQPA